LDGFVRVGGLIPVPIAPSMGQDTRPMHQSSKCDTPSFVPKFNLEQISWWNALSVLSVVNEAAIVALELGIIAHIQLTRQRKASIMSIFACRLL
jgi:hypothetical protein